jgi:hypothetical protein
MEFRIGPEFSHEISNLSQGVTCLNRELNDYFSIKTYGKISIIYVGVICVSKDFLTFFSVRKPVIHRKEPALSIEFSLDFDLVSNMNHESLRLLTLHELEKNFIAALPTLKLKDFDSLSFTKDLRQFVLTNAE